MTRCHGGVPSVETWITTRRARIKLKVVKVRRFVGSKRIFVFGRNDDDPSCDQNGYISGGIYVL